jgi:UMF1 family MFS transporter
VGRDTREQRGWYVYDWANSAFSTTVVTVFYGPYLTGVTQAAADERGFVSVLGLGVRAESYFLYVVSASVLLQVLVMPVVGAIADRSDRKTRLLAGFAWLGALATVAMFLVSGDAYLFGGLLLLLANVAFGAAVVVYNSFLPEIAEPDDRDRVSARGWALGYLGGGLLLLLNLGLFLFHDTLGLSEAFAVRVSLASAGLWWGLFTLVPVRRIVDRPALRLAGDAPMIRGAFLELVATLRRLRSFPRSLLFLAAFLLYNDGIQTVIAAAAIFGSDELELSQTILIGSILVVQAVAFVGALLLGRLAQRFGAKRVVLASLVVWTGTILYGRELPAGDAGGFLLLAVIIGLVLGGTQALSRSLFSHLIPAGREAEYYSLYEISDRGTSWIGTFALGLAVQVTGSYRSGIVVLIAFFVLGGVLLALTDLRRAIEDVGNPQPEVL